MGILQFIALLTVAICNFPTPMPVVILTIFYSLGGAFTEVVTQGLMVVECRKDLALGSEDLNSIAWICYGVGGVVGCITAGILLALWPDGDGARLCFAISSIFPLILGISGPFIDKTLEEN